MDSCDAASAKFRESTGDDDDDDDDDDEDDDGAISDGYSVYIPNKWGLSVPAVPPVPRARAMKSHLGNYRRRWPFFTIR